MVTEWCVDQVLRIGSITIVKVSVLEAALFHVSLIHMKGHDNLSKHSKKSNTRLVLAKELYVMCSCITNVLKNLTSVLREVIVV